MRRFIVSAAVAAAILTGTANFAASQTASDPHQHGQQGAPAGSPGPVDPMMQMMSGMMRMMQMMHGPGGMAQAGGMPMGEMGLTDRVEGRIAFLRAELKVSPAQEKAWDLVAQALRASAERLKKAGGTTMPGQVGILPALEAERTRLQARLDSINEIEAALKPLYDLLSDEQKSTAEELLRPLTGMMGPVMTGPRMMTGMGAGPMGEQLMPGAEAGEHDGGNE